MRRIVNSLLEGAGSILAILPPEHGTGNSVTVRSRGAGEALEADWLKIGGDVQRAMPRAKSEFGQPKAAR